MGVGVLLEFAVVVEAVEAVATTLDDDDMVEERQPEGLRPAADAGGEVDVALAWEALPAG